MKSIAYGGSVVLLLAGVAGGVPPALGGAEPPGATAVVSPSPHVLRWALTRGVVDLEPIDRLEAIGPEIEEVFLFCELSGLQGRSVEHQWLQGEEVRHAMRFDVQSERWRVFTSKRFAPGDIYNWRVRVLDDAGKVLIEAPVRFMTSDEY
ncbi:MAG: DUF2914 domain-containing protein [Halothiobacillaceae bacterium]|nr:DUF2914 domain-containing protein [Halothiobacillaceae bacterium]MDY0049346.1 DUF2914 domain-containing protein [Halothiobacillaceae bacterium]